jgi:hypothetical protein
MSASSQFSDRDGAPVGGGVAHVAARILSRRGPLLGRERTLLPCRHTHHEDAGGDQGVLRYQRRGGDDRLCADLRAGENDRAHADGHPVADGRAMDDGCVSDGDLVADDAGCAAIDVKDRAVLDIGSLPDANRRDVTPDDGVEPDARLGADFDVSDDD